MRVQLKKESDCFNCTMILFFNLLIIILIILLHLISDSNDGFYYEVWKKGVISNGVQFGRLVWIRARFLVLILSFSQHPNYTCYY